MVLACQRDSEADPSEWLAVQKAVHTRLSQRQDREDRFDFAYFCGLDANQLLKRDGKLPDREERIRLIVAAEISKAQLSTSHADLAPLVAGLEGLTSAVTT